MWRGFHKLNDRDQRQQAQSVMNRLLVLTADPAYRTIIGQTKSFKLNDKDALLANLPDTTRGHLITALLMARLTGPIFIQSPHVFVGAGQPIIACEYLEQLPEHLGKRLIATATLIAFRVGVNDAHVLKPELNLRDGDFALTDLPQDYCYVRQETTELAVMPEVRFPYNHRVTRAIRNRSRSDQYSQPRLAVEAKLETFLKNLSG